MQDDNGAASGRWTVDGDGCLVDLDGDRFGGPTVELNGDSYDALVDMVRRQDAQFDRALLAESICRKIVTGGPFAWHQFTDAEVAYLHSLEIEGPS